MTKFLAVAVTACGVFAQAAGGQPIPVDPDDVAVIPLDYPWFGGGPPEVLPTAGQILYDNLTTWASGLNDKGTDGGGIFTPPPRMALPSF